jgi:nitroreductase
MNTKDAIYTRRSVRNYTGKLIDRATIEQLIQAAAQAPSATNIQPWAFGVIQDANLLKEISDSTKALIVGMVDSIPALKSYKEVLSNPDYNLFYNAGTLITICYKQDLSPVPEIDCCLAAENLMLMARDLGLGTCWMGFCAMWLKTPEGMKKAGIPEGYTAVAPIIVGYPKDETGTKEKNEPEIIFWK